MDHRTLLVAAFLAGGLGGLGGLVDSSRAETIATDTGDIAVKESGVATPARGMTMDQVASKFGAPVTKVPAVGKPPISRWEYPGFVVYFEHEHVIHSVVPTAGASPDAPSSTAPSSTAPAAPSSDAPSPTAPSSDAPASDVPTTDAPAASADPAANS